jgi:hypothetical protein
VRVHHRHKGEIIFASNMTRQITLTSLNRKRNTTDMEIYPYVCGVLSLLLFVRIEQNVKIYNTLHLVFFTGYAYKI